MEEASGKPTGPVRNLLWYAKWLFACYAITFALFLLVGIASLPIADDAFIKFWFGPIGGLAMLATAAVLSPIVYRRLK